MQPSANNDVFTATTSRHRLADISHHFLSNKGERPAPWRKTRIVPLLLVAKTDDYVAYLLEEAIRDQNQSCMVLNMEGRVDPASTSTPAQQDESAPDVCLLPLTSPHSTLAIHSDKLLMAVPTSLPGVKLAYHHLALLAAQGRDITVHVIMLDARNERQGERYFAFLCDSARSLLSLEIKRLGVLVRQHTTTDASAPATPACGGVKGIARAILARGEPRVPAPGQGTAKNPAALSLA